MDLGIIGDDEASVESMLDKAIAQNARVLVTSGGVSMVLISSRPPHVLLPAVHASWSQASVHLSGNFLHARARQCLRYNAGHCAAKSCVLRRRDAMRRQEGRVLPFSCQLES